MFIVCKAFVNVTRPIRSPVIQSLFTKRLRVPHMVA